MTTARSKGTSRSSHETSFPAFAVDRAGVELGHELDAALGEHAAERLRGHRLGEGAVEGSDVGELHAVADAPLAEVPIGQEAELERCHGALDRHLDDVDHHVGPRRRR